MSYTNYGGKVIRQAILEAELYAKNLGGEWHVVANPELDVVKRSYFFDESGKPKVKPWQSVYNTTDKLYMESYKCRLVETQLIIYNLSNQNYVN